MKNSFSLYAILCIIILISGCVQQESVQKEKFTKDNLQFLSVDYGIEFVGDVWKSQSDWIHYTCDMCRKGTATAPDGQIHECTNPSKGCNCDISLKIRYNIKLPQGYDYVSCKIYLNGKDAANTGFQVSGGVHEDIGIGSLDGSTRIDNNNIVELCCEGICESKTLTKAC